MAIEIELDSQTGLIIAIENFIYKCSTDVIPENCDREQLVQNIEAMRDLKQRKIWIEKLIKNRP